MKLKPILAAFAVAVAAIAQPALAEWKFIQNDKGEVTHYNGIELPPIPTVEEAKAQAQREISAANKAREAQQAEPATRHSLPATPPQEVFFTGKPYLEETGQYLFLFRHYDPQLARWTNADPSGFPDGANNWQYVANMATLGIDPDGLQFLHFNGSSITVWSGNGRQSNESIDWGTAGTSWAAVSGGTNNAGAIPDGWYTVGAKRPVAGFQDSLDIGVRSEADFTYNGIKFQGTMAAWDKSGYNYHTGPSEYGGGSFYGYDPSDPNDAAIGAPLSVAYKFLLSGAYGNPVTVADGYRIHPKDATSTSGCIGVQGYTDAKSFETWMLNHSGIKLLVE
jgi:RHS repeat-associated protein